MLTKKRLIQITDKFSSLAPVLVIGDIGVDKYTKGRVARISPEAPVPVVEVYKQWNKLGLAANVSDNLQSLSVKNTLCGVIGSDANGNTLEDLLDDSELSTWGLVRCSERMTTVKERIVTDSQQICRVDYESVAPLVDTSRTSLINRIGEFIDKHSYVVLEDYGKGLFCSQSTPEIIKLAKDHGKLVAVDPSRGTDPLLYKGADLLKPNQLESELMAASLGYREKNTEKIAEILIDKLDLTKLIITLGAQGMAILDTQSSSGMQTIPTVAKEVFDVSGAGDTAISTIVASLVTGATLEEAAWLGNFASGIVVGKKGTALVTRSELTALPEDFFKIV